MYMLIIVEIIDIVFYSQRSMAERLSARRRTLEAYIPRTDAVSLCFMYN